MTYGNNEPKRAQKPMNSRKTGTLILSLLLVVALAVGITLAFLTTQTEPIVNTFTPSEVTTEVEEEFDGTEKKNVNATNTGDIDAYIRIKLVTYRVNDDGDHIGGTAEIPAFTPGTGWVKNGDYYYYTQPVAPGESPAVNLISSITLVSSYKDADGGKQAIEVMAEAIQSVPADAVEAAWGATVGTDGVLSF